MSKRSVKKNYIYNLLYQMLAVVIPLLVTPYVARVLGVGPVGAFSYTTAVTGYFVLFGNLGIATYGQLRVAACRNDKKAVSKIFYELVILRFVLMGTASLLFLVFIQVFSAEEYRTLYMVLLIQIASSAVDIAWLLQGFEEFGKIVVRNTVIKVLSVILIFSFVKKPEDLYIYALIMNGSTLLGNMSIWYFAPAFVEWVPLSELEPRRHLRPCIIYFIPTIATTLYLSLDKTMIRWFTTSSVENGYYEQAQKIEQMAATVVTSMSVVTMPRMAYLYSNESVDRLKDRLQQSIRFILMMSIPMCLGMIAVSDNLIPLYLGSGYDKSAVLLKFFSFLIIVVGLNNAVGKQVLMPVGRQKSYNASVIIGACVNVALNSLLIPRLYSVGAVIASVAAETTILLAFIHYSKDYIQLSWILKASVKYLIAGLVMLAAILAAGGALGRSWPVLILQVTAGMAIYVVLILLMRDKFALEMLDLVTRHLPFHRK